MWKFPEQKLRACQGIGALGVKWWRRGRVELPVQKVLQGIYYKLSRCFVSRLLELPSTESPQGQPMFLWLPVIGIRAAASRTFGACSPPPGLTRADVAGVKRLVRMHDCRLFFATCLTSEMTPRLAIHYRTLLSSPRVPISITIIA